MGNINTSTSYRRFQAPSSLPNMVLEQNNLQIVNIHLVMHDVYIRLKLTKYLGYLIFGILTC